MGDFKARVDPSAAPAPAGPPDRFPELVETAELLLDELSKRYVADRREAKEPLGPGEGAELARTVLVMPRTPAAGPLALAFPDSSGVVLRLGRWFVQTFPGAEDDAAELRKLVIAHVEGGLWERVRRRLGESWLETRLIGPGLTITHQAPVDPAEARAARREGFAAPVQWAPWPRRA
ncbi:DUF6226 family protein [Actinoplanes sp. NPDC051494]|uniref:DUF6226 family protein n=1 Tax=Actinoplanes sp. NPDC051494 TaxID=3363907 RepID=UPI00379AD7B3